MQLSLIDEDKKKSITIDLASEAAKVSTATIRNWIKTGYLTQAGPGLVTKTSLENFLQSVAGTQKLNSRANKAHKDQHDDSDVFEKLKNMLDECPAEKIGETYQALLSDSYRNKEGIYYTPAEIVKDMLSKAQVKPDSMFLDPCCGSGNFIVEALRLGVAPTNIYGFDTDENAITILKKRVYVEFGFDLPNVGVGDFFRQIDSLQRQELHFDLIFTNPPWGKKVEKSEREKIASNFKCGSSIDTSALFMGACFNLLKKSGYLGFLVQEAFFNIASFEDIRNAVLSRNILHFIDYGKAFEGLMTKAQAIIINNSAVSPHASVECHVGGRVFNRSQESFRKNAKKIFNFWADEDDSRVIEQLFAINHVRLLGNAQWALGIVTGSNERFCVDKPSVGYIPVYKGSDISKKGLKDATTFITSDFSDFQQVAPLELYQANEKLIYKFISNRLCFFYDDKQRYVLNSANLLIPKLEISPMRLAELLNSEIIGWLFQKLFCTCKVLRGDLELLPIHVEYFEKFKHFSEANYLDFLNIAKGEDGTYRVKRKNN